LHSISIFDLAAWRWTTPWHKLAGFKTWSEDGQWINFIEWRENRGIGRVWVTGGDTERVVAPHGVGDTGCFEVWMGIGPHRRSCGPARHRHRQHLRPNPRPQIENPCHSEQRAHKTNPTVPLSSKSGAALCVSFLSDRCRSLSKPGESLTRF